VLAIVNVWRSVAEACTCPKEKLVSDEYDKERTAALIKEAQELTAHLKLEVKEIETQMGRVLKGDEDEILDALESENAAHPADVLLEPAAGKFLWRFWR
jgi:hypothetical protein